MIVLLPNLLSESLKEDDFFPKNLKREIEKLDGILAESRRSAIRYLIRFLDREKANSLPIILLNEHTKESEIKDIFQKIKNGVWGIVTDAGLPCIADPGSRIVALANDSKIPVKAINGPCSITQGLMLSGLNGQNFSFHGYLPKKEIELVSMIKKLEKRSYEENCTQIFIEAPYRTDKLLNILVSTLGNSVKLCVAADLTMETEEVFSFRVRQWKKSQIKLGKRVAIFLFLSER